MKKKIWTILASLILVLAFTSCSTTDSKEDTALRIGIDLKYPPFMYLDENKQAAGLEPDLARAFGEYLGREVEIVNTDFSMLIVSLESEETDIVISDMSVKEERKQKVDFSDGYRYGRTVTLVNRDFYDEKQISDEMPVEDFFALDGLKMIGLSGTVSTLIPEKYGVEVTEATEISSALMEVVSGNYNVLVGSYAVYGDQAANPDTTRLYLGIPEYSTSAFAVKKGNTELLEKANAFIETLYEEGGLYDELAGKYDETVREAYFNENYGLEYITNKPQ